MVRLAQRYIMFRWRIFNGQVIITRSIQDLKFNETPINNHTLYYRVFGIRLGTCIYALLVVIGQLIFATGAYMNLFWLTIVGRFVFGYLYIARV